MKIDRTKIDIPMINNQRMTSQWWETEVRTNENRQKLGCCHNNQKPREIRMNLQELGWHRNEEKAKEHTHKIRQNLGWHPSDVKLK